MEACPAEGKSDLRELRDLKSSARCGRGRGREEAAESKQRPLRPLRRSKSDDTQARLDAAAGWVCGAGGCLVQDLVVNPLLLEGLLPGEGCRVPDLPACVENLRG